MSIIRLIKIKFMIKLQHLHSVNIDCDASQYFEGLTMDVLMLHYIILLHWQVFLFI